LYTEWAQSVSRFTFFDIGLAACWETQKYRLEQRVWAA